MKKITVIAFALVLTALLSACTPGAVGNDTTDDTTIPVTSPDGFEDVTAPPVADTTAKEETTDAPKDTEEDTTLADTTEKSDKISTPDEAVAAARAYKGEEDKDIGYKYAYSYDGMMTDGGVEYYKIRVSWYIEEQERYSKCGYILVGADGSCKEFDW